MNGTATTDELMGRVRRGSFTVFVAFLSFSALLAIATVLFGEFGDFEVRVLATTSIIATVSICCLCCSAYSGSRNNPLAGAVGIGLAILAGGLWIAGIWLEIERSGYFRGSAIAAIAAVATAHALALLVLRLNPSHRWVQLGTAALIAALAVLLSSLILFETDQEPLLKLMAVLAILVALGTLLVPILGRLTRTGVPVAELILRRGADGVYRDSGGKRYQVIPIEHETAPTPPGAGTIPPD